MPKQKYKPLAPLPRDWKATPHDLIVGRPAKLDANDVQTIATIRECGRHQFGVDPTAAFLGVSSNTLRKFFSDYPAVREVFDAAIEQGRGVLRGYQWAAAAKGNTAMLIWLGKQYLAQKDKLEVAAGDAATNPEDSRDKIATALAALTAGEPIPSGESKGSKRLN